MSVVLVDARVVDGRGLRAEHADLIIEGDRIVDIATGGLPESSAALAGGEVIGLDGATVLPGLVNAHVHLCLDASADPARALLEAGSAERAAATEGRLPGILERGVTTVRDLGAVDGIAIELARRVERREVAGPRILAAGMVVTTPGGHGHWMGLEVRGPDAVRAAVRSQVEAGATAVKVMATAGMMTPGQAAGEPQLDEEELRAAVEEAGSAGLRVAAHAESAAGARNALLAGVHTIEHGHGMGPDEIALMLDRGAALVPTILSDRAIVEGGVEAGIPDFVVADCRRLSASLERTLALAIEADATIVAGNDGGAPLVGAGELAGELELYVRHGMSPLRAIASATSVAADALGLADVGVVESGAIADLLIVDGDPLEDIGALRAVRGVVARGTPHGRLARPV